MTTITLPRAVVEQALDDLRDLHANHNITYAGTISRLEAALAQQQANPPGCDHCNHPLYAATKCRVCGRVTEQAEPDAYGHASRLAVAIWEKHYKDAAPQWTPLDDLMGVLTQIDNMTSGLTRLAQQAEPVEPVRLQCVTCGTVYADGVPPQVPAQQAEPVEPVAWLRVIDEAMVTHHLGVADPGDDYETAKRKMNNLLCMAQDIGTYFAKQAEPVEPVARVMEHGATVRLEWVSADAAHNAKVGPLFSMLPQRKPLTEGALMGVYIDFDRTADTAWSGVEYLLRLCRAVERAHGIGDNP